MALTISAPDAPHAVRLGDAPPRILVRPPFSSCELGREAVELAAMGGLVLDPWQALALEVGLSEDADGQWAAFEVGLIVARQNGKDSIFEALQLAKLLLCDDELIIHSAHEFKTAKEAFRRLTVLIDTSQDLRARVLRMVRNPSEFGIDLRSGQRLRFFARTSGSGRGWTADTLILNESYRLGGEAMAALLPTLSSRPNPQVWYGSSAPLADSEQLHHVRARAVAGAAGGDAGRLAFVEWSAPEDCDPADPEAWAQANPALGHRMSLEFVRAEFDAMPAQQFGRERLSIPDEPVGSAQPIPLDAWAALSDPDGAALELRDLTLGVDMPPDRSSAAVVACGRRPDGTPQVEVVEVNGGSGWVVDRCSSVAMKRWVREVVIDGASAAAALIPALEAAGLTVRKTTTRDYTDACGGLFDAVVGSEVRNVPHPAMAQALAGASKRPLGDAWAFDKRKASADITPLVAAALARWGVTRTGDSAPVVLMV